MEDKFKRPSDEVMKELMENVEERHDGYVKEWLKNPEFRKALHRYDGERKSKKNS